MERKYDIFGYDERGFDINGIHRDTGTKYDKEGTSFEYYIVQTELEREQKQLQETLKKTEELESQVDKQIQQKDKNVTEDKKEEEK